MVKVSLESVLAKLDRLDGTPDGKFMDTKIDSISLSVIKECGGPQALSINCQKYIADLDKLVGIIDKLPMFKLISSGVQKGPALVTQSALVTQINEAFQPEEIFVTLSILMLLATHLDVSAFTDAPIRVTLRTLPFDEMAGMMNEFGATVIRGGLEVQVDYSSVQARNASEAYSIIEGVGKRRRFDPSFFDPSSSGAGPVPTATAAVPTQQSPVRSGGLDFSAYEDAPSPQAPPEKQGATGLNFDKYED